MSKLRRGTYCRERDGATRLYYSELTTWNSPIDALERFLAIDDFSRTSLNQWEIVRGEEEIHDLYKEMNDHLAPGESYTIFGSIRLDEDTITDLIVNSRFAEKVKLEKILGYQLEPEQIEVLSRFKRAVMKEHHREPFDEEYRLVTELKQFEVKPKPQFVKEYVGTDVIEGGFIDKVDQTNSQVVIHTRGETYFLEVETEYDTFGGSTANLRVFRNRLA